VTEQCTIHVCGSLSLGPPPASARRLMPVYMCVSLQALAPCVGVTGVCCANRAPKTGGICRCEWNRPTAPCHLQHSCGTHVLHCRRCRRKAAESQAINRHQLLAIYCVFWQSCLLAGPHLSPHAAHCCCSTAPAGSCQLDSECDGVSADCPAPRIKPFGTPCSRSTPPGTCQLRNVCDGVSGDCPAPGNKRYGTPCPW
jgi:hypothetical protein